MSYYMHRSPWWFHRFETLSNHLIELVFPFLTFLGRRMCMVNGVIQILFQVSGGSKLLRVVGQLNCCSFTGHDVETKKPEVWICSI